MVPAESIAKLRPSGIKPLTAVSVSHVTLSVGITSFTENIMSNTIGVTGERSTSSQLKIAER